MGTGRQSFPLRREGATRAVRQEPSRPGRFPRAHDPTRPPYLHRLIPTEEEAANQGSRMYTQRTQRAPRTAASSAGLSWSRSPLRNQCTEEAPSTPAAGVGTAAAAVTTAAAITALTAQASATPPPSAPRAPPPVRPVTYDAAAPPCSPTPEALERPCHWLGASGRAIGPAAGSPAPPPHVPTMCRSVREEAAGWAGDASCLSLQRSGRGRSL